MRFRNCLTLEAFREVVHTCANELEEMVREWQESEGQDFLLAFARQLEGDFHRVHHFDLSDPEGRLTAMGTSMALSRVDWPQVAERLVEYSQEGPHPEHLTVRCWCSKPLRSWPSRSQADPPVLVKGGSRA